jgi:hypothetical protein
MPKSYCQTMALVVCTPFAVAAAAAHATTCWIDHVEKRDGGVRLFFIQRDHMIVHGTITGQNDEFVVVNGRRLLRQTCPWSPTQIGSQEIGLSFQYATTD